MKRCSNCKENKPLNEFFNNKAKRDGKSSECKTCDKMRSAERRKSAQGKERIHQGVV